MMLCFPLPQNVDHSRVTPTLQQATRRLTEVIPWLGGQVVSQKEAGKSDIYQVVAYDAPVLRIKHLDEFPSYEEFRKARAPASILDANITAPMKGFPDSADPSVPKPVLVIQANFLSGGLILCFAGMHNVMDGTGLGQLVKHFATLCRGEQIASRDIEAVLLDRGHIPPPLQADQPLLDHSDVRKKAEQSTDASAHEVRSIWSYFSISSTKLAQLKAEASKDIENKDDWVTSNDALTALMWKAVTKARYARLDRGEQTTLVRAVNGRRKVKPPIPDGYIGNSVHATFNFLTIEQIANEESLSKLAQRVRKTTNEIDDHYVRSFAALLRSEPDLREIVFAMRSPDRDLLVSSWATLPVYADFGSTIGKPEFARRPTGASWESVVYIMPKSPDGDIDLTICMREDDLARLQKEQDWTAYVEFIG
ncbi:MAG: hypothetical protein LQ351_001153 [Letrouitia transgressa]|nr:MAG: hypothetical protein LQ351_001153 [Letrouitia transgressa]